MSWFWPTRGVYPHGPERHPAGWIDPLLAPWLVLVDLAIWSGWTLLWTVPLHAPPLPLALVWPWLVGVLFLHAHVLVPAQPLARRQWVVPLGPVGRHGVWLASSALPVVAFGAFWGILYRQLPFVPPNPGEAIRVHAMEPWSALPVALVAIALAPLIEEFIVRGWILGTLSRAWGHTAGVVISSLLFAAVHGSAGWVPYYFVQGLILGVSVVVTGTLWPAVVYHACHNALAQLLNAGFFAGAVRHLESEPAWAAAGLAACAAVMWAHVLWFRRVGSRPSSR